MLVGAAWHEIVPAEIMLLFCGERVFCIKEPG
jgi:hypothetical protein